MIMASIIAACIVTLAIAFQSRKCTHKCFRSSSNGMAAIGSSAAAEAIAAAADDDDRAKTEGSARDWECRSADMHTAISGTSARERLAARDIAKLRQRAGP